MPLPSSVVDLLFRLLIDLVALVVLLRGAFLRRGGDPSRLLTLAAFNVVLFLIAHLLNQVEMTMGAAFGLFAVFSMLRVRTEGISSRDMTYLFLGIALGLVTAVADPGPVALPLLAGVIPALALVLESGWLVPVEASHEVIYDRLALLAPAARAELLADLRARTGIPVTRVDVQRIDLLKDVAHLQVYGPLA